MTTLTTDRCSSRQSLTTPDRRTGDASFQQRSRATRPEEPSSSPSRVSFTVINLALMAALILTIIVATALGPVRLPIREVIRAFCHPIQAGDASTIIFSLRLPRVLAAAIVGAALAATGVLFQ